MVLEDPLLVPVLQALDASPRERSFSDDAHEDAEPLIFLSNLRGCSA